MDDWFADETCELVGLYDLDEESVQLVYEIFFDDLSDVVAAMWSIDGRLPDAEIQAAMARFPLARVFKAKTLLERAGDEQFEDLIQVVAMLRNIGLAERQAGERE
jgi:hypothetical protein